MLMAVIMVSRAQKAIMPTTASMRLQSASTPFIILPVKAVNLLYVF